jgi:plastocyanin
MKRSPVICATAVLVAAAAAARTDVRIEGFLFVPATVSIPLGETVRWTNFDVDMHTSTADNGKWDSGPLSQNQFYDFVFNDYGAFPYHCTPHPWMVGKVVVTGVGVAPASFGRVKALYR